MISRRLVSPIRVDLVLNADCNHKCVHCYNPWREEKPCIQSLKGAEFRSKFDLIAQELVRANVWSVILTGGEPLLHPHELFYAIDVLQRYNISMCLNTNLTLMTEDIAHDLIHKHGWNNMVLTSLPSIDEVRCDKITQIRGSYQAILKGIKKCVDCGIRVGINTVITRANIDDLNHYAEFIRKHNIEYLSISIVIPPVYDAKNSDYYLTGSDITRIADTLLDIKSECGIEIGSVTPLPLCLLYDADKYMPVLETTCLAGISKCSIHIVDGRVTACAHEDGSYGNIYDDGLAVCWQNMTKWSEGHLLAQECRNCKWLFLCGGECRMMRREGYMTSNYKLNPEAEIIFNGTNSDNTIKMPNPTDILRVNPSLKIRKETEGYIVRTGFIETRMSDSMWNICKALQSLKSFTLHDIWTIVREDDTSRIIISILFSRNIIERVTVP